MTDPRSPHTPPTDAPGETDPRVGGALRGLPAAAASAAFTDGVLARMPGVRRKRARRLLLPVLIGAAAAAAVLVLAMRPRTETELGRSEAQVGVTAKDRAEALVIPGKSDLVIPGRSEQPVAKPGDRGAIAAELARLRREQRELAAEIEDQRAHEELPSGTVIYVGQRAGVDVMLDLARFDAAMRPRKAGERQ